MSLSDTERAAAWQLQSLLLGCPDRGLLDRRPPLRRAAEALPSAVGAPLHPLLDHLDGADTFDLESEYVATFDHRKKLSPYLTYFLYGDTRKRGMALLRFEQVYRSAGMPLDDEQLPDHLAVVLEFAAEHIAAGQQLLDEYRVGLELMRLGLRDAGSPWAGVLDSVRATVRPLQGDDMDALARLIAEGSPDDEAGLEPFAASAYVPPPGRGRR